MGEPVGQRQGGEVFLTFRHGDSLGCWEVDEVGEIWDGTGVSELCDPGPTYAIDSRVGKTLDNVEYRSPYRKAVGAQSERDRKFPVVSVGNLGCRASSRDPKVNKARKMTQVQAQRVSRLKKRNKQRAALEIGK